jgi:hypothetical protein
MVKKCNEHAKDEYDETPATPEATASCPLCSHIANQMNSSNSIDSITTIAKNTKITTGVFMQKNDMEDLRFEAEKNSESCELTAMHKDAKLFMVCKKTKPPNTPVEIKTDVYSCRYFSDVVNAVPNVAVISYNDFRNVDLNDPSNTLIDLLMKSYDKGLEMATELDNIKSITEMVRRLLGKQKIIHCSNNGIVYLFLK